MLLQQSGQRTCRLILSLALSELKKTKNRILTLTITQMKTLKIILFILLWSSTLSYAGEIYGTISKEGRPLVKAKVLIATNDGNVLDSAVTDANGYFSITIKQVGQFILRINEPEFNNAFIHVSSNNNSTGYDLILFMEDKLWKLKTK